jgi:hypothetical protein
VNLEQGTTTHDRRFRRLPLDQLRQCDSSGAKSAARKLTAII